MILLPIFLDLHTGETVSLFDSYMIGETDEELAEAISGKGAFRRFKATVRFHGIEQQWYVFLAEAYKAIAIQWCKDNQLEHTTDTEN